MSVQKQGNTQAYPIGEYHSIFDKLAFIRDLLNQILIQQKNKELCSLLALSTIATLKPKRSTKLLVADFENAYPDLISFVESDRNSDHPTAHNLLREIYFLCGCVCISKLSKKIAKSNLLILAKGIAINLNDGNEINQDAESLIIDILLLRALVNEYTIFGDGILGLALNKLKKDRRVTSSRYDKGILSLLIKITKTLVKYREFSAIPYVITLIKEICDNSTLIPGGDVKAIVADQSVYHKKTNGLLKVIFSMVTSPLNIKNQAQTSLAIAGSEIDKKYFAAQMREIDQNKIISRIGAIQDYAFIEAIPVYITLSETFSNRFNSCLSSLTEKKFFFLTSSNQTHFKVSKVSSATEVECIISTLTNLITSSCNKAPIGISPLLTTADLILNSQKPLFKAGISKKLINNLSDEKGKALLYLEEYQVDFVKSTREAVFQNVTELVLNSGIEAKSCNDLKFAKELVDTHGEGVFIDIPPLQSKPEPQLFKRQIDNIEDGLIINSDQVGSNDFHLENSNNPIVVPIDPPPVESTQEDEHFESIFEGIEPEESKNHQTDQVDNYLQEIDGLRKKLKQAASLQDSTSNLLDVSKNKSNKLAGQLVEIENKNTVLVQETEKLDAAIRRLQVKASKMESAAAKLTSENTLLIASNIKLEAEREDFKSRLFQAESKKVDSSLIGQLNQLIDLFENFSRPLSESLLHLDLSIGEMLHSNPESMLDSTIQDKLHELFDSRQQAAKSNPKFINDLQASKMSKKSNSGLKATDFDPSLPYSLDSSTLHMIIDKKTSLEAAGKIPSAGDIRATLNLISTTLNNLKSYEEFERIGNVTDQARDLVSYQAESGLDAVKEMTISLVSSAPENLEMIDRVLTTFSDRQDVAGLIIGDTLLEDIIMNIKESAQAAIDGGNIVELSKAR